MSLLEEKEVEDQQINDITEALLNGQQFKSDRNLVSFHTIMEDSADDVDFLNRLYCLMNEKSERERMMAGSTLKTKIESLIRKEAEGLWQEDVRA